MKTKNKSIIVPGSKKIYFLGCSLQVHQKYFFLKKNPTKSLFSVYQQKKAHKGGEYAMLLVPETAPAC